MLHTIAKLMVTVPIVYLFLSAIIELHFIMDRKTVKQIRLYSLLGTVYLHLAFYLLTI